MFFLAYSNPTLRFIVFIIQRDVIMEQRRNGPYIKLSIPSCKKIFWYLLKKPNLKRLTRCV